MCTRPPTTQTTATRNTTVAQSRLVAGEAAEPRARSPLMAGGADRRWRWRADAARNYDTCNAGISVALGVPAKWP